MAFKWFALNNKKKEFEFMCSECSDIHKGSPSFSHRLPAYALDVPDNEHNERLYYTDDVCVVDDEHFFIRVILEIPIIEVEDPFTWGVWVSQSEDNFMQYQETYGTDQSATNTFGWFTVNLPYYKALDSNSFLESLECDVRWGVRGQRPHLNIYETKHELFTDQNESISWDKAVKIAQLAMHPK
ncbi:MAG: DUF2199 domain-containing protein [Robiginitomaculum sp.]|nr:DUF2199 domain-containing protein [Robiginitomaculum sp.]